MPAITGDPRPKEQRPRRRWTKKEGWKTFRVWHGTDAAINGLIPQVQASYTEIDVEPAEPGFSRLLATAASATDGAKEQPVNLWELLGTGMSESLTKHPKWPNDTRLQNILNGKTEATSFVVSDFGDSPIAQAFWKLLVNEQKEFQASQWVVRHTRTTSSNFQGSVAVANANTLVSNANMVKQITDKQVRAAVAAIPAQSPPDGHEWSWLQQTPTITETLDGKVQVVTEWWLYHWPTILYS